SRLSVCQLRAVLLHEAMHLRRGDVWTNCAQTLLQIAYWWHPLLWLANIRIRRLREEAVDDAVMLALRDGADAYAATLLEVAKYAFRHPFASLGLVGILESRSALRQRVERLINFGPPRRAGVTVLSLCGIFVFCAVALPMGQGPASALSAAPVSTNPSKTADPLILVRKSQALFRVLDKIHIDISYTNTPLDEALNDLTKRTRERNSDPQGISFIFQPRDPPSLSVGPPDIRLTLTLTNASLASISDAICHHCDHPVNYRVSDEGVIFSDGPYCEMRTFKTGTNLFLSNLRELAGAPIPTSDKYVSAFLTDLFEAAGVDLSPSKFVAFNQLPGGVLFVYATPSDMNVIEHIVEILDESGGGENLWLKSINHPTYLNRSAADTKSNAPRADNPVPADKKGISEQADSALNQALAVEHKEAHMDLTSQVIVSPDSASDDSDDLVTEHFPVGSAAFVANVRKMTGEPDFMAGFRELAANAGVDLSPPKTLSLSEGMGFLHVYASKKDLEIIKGIIADLHCPPTMIHVKARFIEVPRKFFSSAAAESLPPGMTNGSVLSAAETKTVLRLLESQKGYDEIAEPEVTTISGRQTEMRATMFQVVATNYIAGPNRTSTDPAGFAISPQTALVETGPILNVIPLAFADGYSIGLVTTAKLVKWFGYAPRGSLPITYVTNSAGQKVPLPFALPAVQLSQAKEQKTVHDGETIVLFPEPTQLLFSVSDTNREEVQKHIQRAEKKYGDKVLVTFVTTTLIDAAGNRIHPALDSRFAPVFQPVPAVTNWAGTLPL
ncbi:MAG TPA: M56 family metallopeptidase, partial [Verrucomicrobiae bacterium]